MVPAVKFECVSTEGGASANGSATNHSLGSEVRAQSVRKRGPSAPLLFLVVWERMSHKTRSLAYNMISGQHLHVLCLWEWSATFFFSCQPSCIKAPKLDKKRSPVAKCHPYK